MTTENVADLQIVEKSQSDADACLAGHPPVRTGLFKFVPHSLVEAHHRAGWMIVQADLSQYHGYFSVLMWRCRCGQDVISKRIQRRR